MIQLSRRFINIANSGLKIPRWLSNVPVRVRPSAFIFNNVAQFIKKFYLQFYYYIFIICTK